MNHIILFTLISFFISMVSYSLILPIFKLLKFSQPINEEAPKNHKKKTGVLTMGGIIFILSSVLLSMIFLGYKNVEVLICILSLLLFGAVGFIDDVLKICGRHNKGLSPFQKLVLLIIVSSFLSFFTYFNPSISKEIFIPFIPRFLNLGIYYIPFTLFFYLSTTNAVNLTDGVDGLVTTLILIILTFFTVISIITNHYNLALFSSILCGSLLGFLKFNSYPAKIIMGDTGSLALGGIISSIALILNLQITILIVGLIFVIEVLSVIIQVIFFKITGRKLFPMTPIHHSFELKGWHESKILSLFSIITLILCLICTLIINKYMLI